MSLRRKDVVQLVEWLLAFQRLNAAYHKNEVALRTSSSLRIESEALRDESDALFEKSEALFAESSALLQKSKEKREAGESKLKESSRILEDVNREQDRSSQEFYGAVGCNSMEQFNAQIKATVNRA